MSESESRIDENIRLFSELMSCQGDYFLWTCDPAGTLLSSNSSYLYLDMILKRSSAYPRLLEHAAQSPSPMVVSGKLGLLWGAVPERGEQGLRRIHMLGPVFTLMPSREEIDRYLHGSAAVHRWSPKLIRRLESLPVIPFTNFCQRILMLDYCVTGEHLPIGDLTFYAEEQEDRDDSAFSREGPDRRRVYQAESALLDMVRQGDPDYRKHLHQIVSAFRGDQRLAKNPLQHARFSQVVIVALLSWAAMEGGVSPELVYPLQDACIQNIDRAGSPPEITEIGLSLIDELIRLVRKSKESGDFSRPVRLCRDYIEAHLEDDISLAGMARSVGYAEYYLSRKFRAETGMSVNDFIKTARIERAMALLANTDLPIAEVAQRLHFGSRGFFSDVFRKQTGLPPARWREENRRV